MCLKNWAASLKVIVTSRFCTVCERARLVGGMSVTPFSMGKTTDPAASRNISVIEGMQVWDGSTWIFAWKLEPKSQPESISSKGSCKKCFKTNKPQKTRSLQNKNKKEQLQEQDTKGLRTASPNLWTLTHMDTASHMDTSWILFVLPAPPCPLPAPVGTDALRVSLCCSGSMAVSTASGLESLTLWQVRVCAFSVSNFAMSGLWASAPCFLFTSRLLCSWSPKMQKG